VSSESIMRNISDCHHRITALDQTISELDTTISQQEAALAKFEIVYREFLEALSDKTRRAGKVIEYETVVVLAFRFMKKMEDVALADSFASNHEKVVVIIEAMQAELAYSRGRSESARHQLSDENNRLYRLKSDYNRALAEEALQSSGQRA
jgi:hypothetical protein